MKNLREKFLQLGFFSKLFFPAELERPLLDRVNVTKMNQQNSSYYWPDYQPEAVWTFCENYKIWMENTSWFNRFRHWLFDFLVNFNETPLMKLWSSTQERGHGLEEFSALAHSSNSAHVCSLQRGILSCRSRVQESVYQQYLHDMAHCAHPDCFAILLNILDQKGIYYGPLNNNATAIARRKTMFVYLEQNPSVYKKINDLFQSLDEEIQFSQLISVEEVVEAYPEKKLEDYLSSVKNLHQQTLNPSLKQSALTEHLPLVKLLFTHQSPLSLSNALVILYKQGLLIKNKLVSEKEQEELNQNTQVKSKKLTDDFEKIGKGLLIKKPAALSKDIVEKTILNDTLLEKERKITEYFINRYNLPSCTKPLDIEQMGINALRLANHPDPEEILKACFQESAPENLASFSLDQQMTYKQTLLDNLLSQYEQLPPATQQEAEDNINPAPASVTGYFANKGRPNQTPRKAHTSTIVNN